MFFVFRVYLAILVKVTYFFFGIIKILIEIFLEVVKIKKEEREREMGWISGGRFPGPSVVRLWRATGFFAFAPLKCIARKVK